jgi:hypothetical protein
MGQLEGKVAIVTGASRGIGAAAAFVLAKAGAAVMLVARATEGGHRGSPTKLSPTMAKPWPCHVILQITDRFTGWSMRPSAGWAV